RRGATPVRSLGRTASASCGRKVRAARDRYLPQPVVLPRCDRRPAQSRSKLRVAGKLRDRSSRLSSPRRPLSKSRPRRRTDTRAEPAVRPGGSRRLSGPASSLPLRLLVARVITQFPWFGPKNAMWIAGGRAALQVAFRCEPERPRVGKRGGGGGVQLLQKSTVVGIRDLSAGKFDLQPAACSHGVAVTGEECVRLSGEVHLLHAGDGISPGGCRGFWHVRGRVRALVFSPGHGCDDALHLEFGSGFSRHDETSGNRQNLPLQYARFLRLKWRSPGRKGSN